MESLEDTTGLMRHFESLGCILAIHWCSHNYPQIAFSDSDTTKALEQFRQANKFVFSNL